MPSVTRRVDTADFAAEMARMRQWLDYHKSRVENFEYYKLVPSIIVVQLDFTEDAEACEFATEFNSEAALHGQLSER